MSENTVLENKATADRDPSPLHESMAAWLEETTGYKPDLKTVQLVASLRIKYQRSEQNQEDLAARRKAAEDKVKAREEAAIKRAEAAEARKVAKAEADAAKLAKKEADAKAAAEKAAQEIDPNDPEAPQLPIVEKPKRKAPAKKATAAKTATAKPAARRRTTKAAAAPAEATEEA